MIFQSISTQNGQYSMNVFYPIQQSSEEYVVLCTVLPLKEYPKLLFVRKLFFAAGGAVSLSAKTDGPQSVYAGAG
ncbi:MAG: hypothetical protein LKE53_06330 [Oscillospiraceae bacterium]|nr:hypothetical protein [Oscillospiraceae bacterium]MDD3260899.1 hypothetical protein [Oscillospiraceae bacterium]